MSKPVELAAAWDARVLDLTGRLPAWLGSTLFWLRHPSRTIIRGIAAGFLVLGGVFAILPVLGLWMLPLGVGLLAEDVPGLKPHLERSSRWLARQWARLAALRGRG